jgi:hypothetical protein
MVLPHIPVNEHYYSRIAEIFKAAKTDQQIYNAIVEGPFHDKPITTMFGLGIVVLLLVNPKTKTIDRIAVSNNDLTRGTFEMTSKPFHLIKIPLNNRENYIAIAIRSRHYMITSDWYYLFTPELSEQDARFNQAGGGISCSAVYPLLGVPNGGALIFSFFESIDRIGPEHHSFMKKYAELAAQALKR